MLKLQVLIDDPEVFSELPPDIMPILPSGARIYEGKAPYVQCAVIVGMNKTLSDYQGIVLLGEPVKLVVANPQGIEWHPWNFALSLSPFLYLHDHDHPFTTLSNLRFYGSPTRPDQADKDFLIYPVFYEYLTPRQKRLVAYYAALSAGNRLQGPAFNAEDLGPFDEAGPLLTAHDRYVMRLRDETWDDRALALRDLSAMFDISISALTKYCRNGLLTAKRRGKLWYACPDEVELRMKQGLIKPRVEVCDLPFADEA